MVLLLAQAAVNMTVLLVVAIAIPIVCHGTSSATTTYNPRSVEGAGDKVCPSSQAELRDSIHQDVVSLINNIILPEITPHPQRPCDCGGPGWTRVAYLNMSDTTQTSCPGDWELITTPKRSCGRPANADRRTCHSAFFQSLSYSQVCGRIVGYQFGHPQAFVNEYTGHPQTIDGAYVDGVSLTYGNPRQHIWTFAAALQETTSSVAHVCPCNHNRSASVPSYIGNDYFCETGVPTGQTHQNGVFYADDPLWDGEGCGPTSACCTFNNPPWFCKHLPQPTNDDLEIRLCGYNAATYENTPIELVEIYSK